MNTIEISNESLCAKIHLKGAEPFMLSQQGNDHNWLWSADPLWPRTAPLLFPIVGKLKEDSYRYQGKSYKLPQHGFARDSIFEVVKKSDSHVHLRLSANKETLNAYPFHFELNVFYSLEGDTFKMKCHLKNLEQEELLYNFGWHPGFVLPKQNRKVRLGVDKNLGMFQRLKGGLISDKKYELSKIENEYDLDASLFVEDALVFLSNTASEFTIKDEGGAYLKMSGTPAPYFGLWTKDVSRFICLEPWWGHASLLNEESQDLENKVGIKRCLGEVCLADLMVEVKQ